MASNWGATGAFFTGSFFTGSFFAPSKKAPSLKKYWEHFMLFCAPVGKHQNLQSGTSSEAAKYLTGTMSCIRYMKFDKTNYTMESTFIINKLLTQ
jgi:hypothetical protein